MAGISRRIKSLRTTKNNAIDIAADEIAYLYEELMRFQKVNSHKLKDDQQLEIERCKTELIEVFFYKLNQEKAINKKNKEIAPHKRFFAYVFSIIGTVFAGVNGFSVGRALLQIIPNLSDPIALAGGVIFGVLESLLFIGIDVLDVKKTFGVSSLNMKPILKEYKNQLEETKKSSCLLVSNCCARRLSSGQYISCQRAMNTFTQDIREKNEKLVELCKESPLRKAARFTISALNGALCTGSGVLAGKSLLILLGATALASTPVGWAISAAIGFFSLASFVYLKRKNIFNVFDKLSGNPKALKKEQDKFIQSESGAVNFNNEVDAIIAEKSLNEAKEKQLNSRVQELEQAVSKLQLTVAETQAVTSQHKRQREEERIEQRKTLKYPSIPSSSSTASLAKRLFFHKSKKSKIDYKISPQQCVV